MSAVRGKKFLLVRIFFERKPPPVYLEYHDEKSLHKPFFLPPAATTFSLPWRLLFSQNSKNGKNAQRGGQMIIPLLDLSSVGEQKYTTSHKFTSEVRW
jgi:hypothetical protein